MRTVMCIRCAMSPTGVTCGRVCRYLSKCHYFHVFLPYFHEMVPFAHPPSDPPDPPDPPCGRSEGSPLSNVQDKTDPDVHPNVSQKTTFEVCQGRYRGDAEVGTTRMSIFVRKVDICPVSMKFHTRSVRSDTPTVNVSKLTTVDGSSSDLGAVSR